MYKPRYSECFGLSCFDFQSFCVSGSNFIYYRVIASPHTPWKLNQRFRWTWISTRDSLWCIKWSRTPLLSAATCLVHMMKTGIFMLSEYFNTLFCFLFFTIGTFRFCNERNNFWFLLCGKISKSFQSQSRGKNDPSACLCFAILGSGVKAILSKKSPIVFCPWYLTKIVHLVEFQK